MAALAPCAVEAGRDPVPAPRLSHPGHDFTPVHGRQYRTKNVRRADGSLEQFCTSRWRQVDPAMGGLSRATSRRFAGTSRSCGVRPAPPPRWTHRAFGHGPHFPPPQPKRCRTYRLPCHSARLRRFGLPPPPRSLPGPEIEITGCWISRAVFRLPDDNDWNCPNSSRSPAF